MRLVPGYDPYLLGYRRRDLAVDPGMPGHPPRWRRPAPGHPGRWQAAGNVEDGPPPGTTRRRPRPFGALVGVAPQLEAESRTWPGSGRGPGSKAQLDQACGTWAVDLSKSWQRSWRRWRRRRPQPAGGRPAGQRGNLLLGDQHRLGRSLRADRAHTLPPCALPGRDDLVAMLGRGEPGTGWGGTAGSYCSWASPAWSSLPVPGAALYRPERDPSGPRAPGHRRLAPLIAARPAPRRQPPSSAGGRSRPHLGLLDWNGQQHGHHRPRGHDALVAVPSSAGGSPPTGVVGHCPPPCWGSLLLAAMIWVAGHAPSWPEVAAIVYIIPHRRRLPVVECRRAPGLQRGHGLYNTLPLYGALLSSLFLGRQLSLAHLVAGGLIVGRAVWAVAQARHPAAGTGRCSRTVRTGMPSACRPAQDRRAPTGLARDRRAPARPCRDASAAGRGTAEPAQPRDRRAPAQPCGTAERCSARTAEPAGLPGPSVPARPSRRAPARLRTSSACSARRFRQWSIDNATAVGPRATFDIPALVKYAGIYSGGTRQRAGGPAPDWRRFENGTG